MNGHGRSTGGFGIEREESVLLIVRTALEHGVEDPRQIAYMLATAQHETRDFSAPDEDFGRSQARKLGYSGGEEFYGRGYVHLTHDYNYRKFDELLGLGGELVAHPDRAKDPELAATILVLGMRDGLFTGRRLDRYINEESHDAYNARRVVNGITRQGWTIKAAEDCERHAAAWEQVLPGLIERARMQAEAPPQGWPHDFQRTLEKIHPAGPARQPPVIRGGLPDFLNVHPAEARAALREGLRQGARGEAVRDLQRLLDGLGIRDGRGQPLAADGIFGTSTRQAVENFQLWNGLETTGVVDRHTRGLILDPALRNASAAPRGSEDAAAPAYVRAATDPRDPSHPDHAMYRRIRAGVGAIDEASGRSYDETSERISRCLLARCKAGIGPGTDVPAPTPSVLGRVDHVVMGTTGWLFAIEGRLDDPAQRRVQVPIDAAARVPVEESDRVLATAQAHAATDRHNAPRFHPVQT